MEEGTPPSLEDPLRTLEACHRQIEAALAVVERVADLEALAELDEPARRALRGALAFFAANVPQHSADEDDLLIPRVQAALEGHAGPTGLLEVLYAEHGLIEMRHQELERLGGELLTAGRFPADEERRRFLATLSDLQNRYRGHIRAEEEELFPLAAQLLQVDEMRALGAEMAARRRG
jgi:hemerythrin-like domain-containing protein